MGILPWPPADVLALLPSSDVAVWTENLNLARASSEIPGLFGEVLSLAGELGAMDRLGLGVESRPETEVIARRSLEASFDEKRGELVRQLDIFDRDIQTNVSGLIERLRTGEIDFTAEAQAAFGSASTEIVETTGYLTLLFLEYEWQAEKVKSESK